MIYSFLKVLAVPILHIIFRLKGKGTENIPSEGGAIFAVNHRSNWDVIVVGATCPRRLRYMAKAEMFKTWIGKKFFTSLGAFPINRGKSDIGAVKSALKILKNGEIILMFPEGHRIKDGNTRVKAKTGVSMFAIKAKKPVIPVKISGKYRLFSKITVTYGAPIVLDEYYDAKLEGDTLQKTADYILDSVRGLEE